MRKDLGEVVLNESNFWFGNANNVHRQESTSEARIFLECKAIKKYQWRKNPVTASLNKSMHHTVYNGKY